MKQKQVRRFQNIPIHAGYNNTVEYVERVFKKHNLPILGNIQDMTAICHEIQYYNKKQIDDLRIALDKDIASKQTHVLNDKYAK